MSDTPAGTYVYCLVAAARRPSLARVPRGLAGLGAPRLLDIERGRWLVVADARLDEFGGRVITRRLRDLEWVGRAAVAHESVVEAFDGARAVLPMKLFTIFTSDARAVDHVRRARARTGRLIGRVAGRQEWGVRAALAPRRPAARPRSAPTTGSKYLLEKKADRDARAAATRLADEAVSRLYDWCAAASTKALRREPDQVGGGSLLLDGVFLVPRARAARFRSMVARLARALAADGVRVMLTGPWPPYTFVKD